MWITNITASAIQISDYFAATGIKYLFPVQAKTLDLIYDGFDVQAQASKCEYSFHRHVLKAVCTKAWYCFDLNVESTVAINSQNCFTGTGTGKTVSIGCCNCLL